MQYRILQQPPLSGELPECRFDARGNCTWVVFADDHGEWCGVFGDGDAVRNHHAVVPFADNVVVFVIANGAGYVVDTLRRQLLYRTPLSYWVAAISVPDRDFVVAADFTSLAAIGRHHELWRSQRIATDGIVLDAASSDQITGKVWCNGGWYPFCLHVDGWRYEQKLTPVS